MRKYRRNPEEPPKGLKGSIFHIPEGQRLIMYRFNLVKKDNIEGWYLDWKKHDGRVLTPEAGAPFSRDVKDVEVGDFVADETMSAVPYWQVSFVDEAAGRVYVDPIPPNPFLTGVGAGGYKFRDEDYEVFSGEYERKRIDDVLEKIRSGKVAHYSDVAYLLLGTVPLNFGPNGPQGGWYNPADTRANRGGQKGMEEREIIMADAATLKKMGFDVPPAVLDGSIDEEVWHSLIYSAGGLDLRLDDPEKLEKQLGARLEGEDWFNPNSFVKLLMEHPQPEVKHRNLKALLFHYIGPYPWKEINALLETDRKKANEMQKAYHAGAFRRAELDDQVKQIFKAMARLKHPAQNRMGFDPYWLTKEQVIITAQRFGWPDVLRAYEKAFDSTNRRYVAGAYRDMGDAEALFRMEAVEDNYEVLGNILNGLMDILRKMPTDENGQALADKIAKVIAKPKYNNLPEGDYYGKELANTVKWVRRAREL